MKILEKKGKDDQTGPVKFNHFFVMAQSEGTNFLLGLSSWWYQMTSQKKAELSPALALSLGPLKFILTESFKSKVGDKVFFWNGPFDGKLGLTWFELENIRKLFHAMEAFWMEHYLIWILASNFLLMKSSKANKTVFSRKPESTRQPVATRLLNIKHWYEYSKQQKVLVWLLETALKLDSNEMHQDKLLPNTMVEKLRKFCCTEE